MLTSITTVDPRTGIRRTVSLRGPHGTHRHLAVFRRYRRVGEYDPEIGGWRTEPADWYLAWGERTGLGTSYSYEGLENERGFRTKKEALARKRAILAEGRK